MAGSSAPTRAGASAFPGRGGRVRERWGSRLRGSRPVRWAASTRLVRGVRGSLTTRIALAILGAGVLAFAVFATLVSFQLRDQVFAARRDAVLEDANVRFTQAQSTFDQSTASTPDEVQDAANQTMTSLQDSAAGAGAVSAMLLRAPGTSRSGGINEVVDTEISGVITAPMRDAVAAGAGDYWQSVAVPVAGGSRHVPGIVVGTLVNLPIAGVHELFIVYSLQSEQDTIDLVMRILGIGSVPVILAAISVTWWLVRRLMRPVQRTAQASRRVAAGDLGARLAISGEDEMAQMGQAFNNMAESLQHQITEYDRLAKFQQRFVSDVSHELRTPLTTIRMAEEMLYDARDSFDPAQKRSAELLHGQVARFEQMLADLLEISRYDAQQALLDAEVSDVRPIVARVEAANRELARHDGAEVRLHMADAPCAAEIDARRIERIVRNLVVNAIEHSEGRPVDVTVAQDARSVAVRVRDHGVGMSEHTVAHVFDRFFRADPARTRTTGGTGLGLSIAKEDVELHHGTIRAYGEPGAGSAFLMVIPKSQKQGEPGPGPLPLWEEDA